MIIENFLCQIDKEKVLFKLSGGASTQNHFLSSFYDETILKLHRLLKPVGEFKQINRDEEQYPFLKKEDEQVFAVLLSLGETIDERINHCFLKGNYMEGLLLDIMANETLFAMDAFIREQIEYYCRNEKTFIVNRYSPLDQIDIKYQKNIVSAMEMNVFVNPSGVLTPLKSLSYFLTAGEKKGCSDHKNNCSQCKIENCIYKNDKNT